MGNLAEQLLKSKSAAWPPSGTPNIAWFRVRDGAIVNDASPGSSFTNTGWSVVPGVFAPNGVQAMGGDGQVDSRLYIASAPNSNFGTGDWYFSYYIYRASSPSNAYIFDFSANGLLMQMFDSSFRAYPFGDFLVADQLPDLNGWNFIELYRIGGVATVSRQGVKRTSTSVTTYSSPMSLSIGSYGGTGFTLPSGSYLADMRFYKL